jgi:hypothetical protein
MTTGVIWTRRSQHDLGQLDQQTAARIIDAMVRFAATGHGDVTRLTGSHEPRLRVGNYHVRFIRRSQAIEVVRVLPRGQAYRDV